MRHPIFNKLKEQVQKRFFRILMMSLLMSQMAVGLSDPINQSLTEFNNLTRADNVLEVAQEMNVWVDGLFGIIILIIIFGVSFSVTLFFRNEIPKAMLFSMFITTITSILLYVVDLVPDQAVFFSVPLFLLSVVYAIVTR